MCRIQSVTDSMGVTEHHGLINVTPDDAALKIIRKLNGTYLKGKRIGVKNTISLPEIDRRSPEVLLWQGPCALSQFDDEGQYRGTGSADRRVGCCKTNPVLNRPASILKFEVPAATQLVNKPGLYAWNIRGYACTH